MRFIKLKSAGESCTLTVTACAPATAGQYPGILFEGDADGARVGVEMPPSSAQRQLDRLNLDSESVVGKTITISRDENPSNPARPYWGITLAGNATHTTKPPTKAANAEPESPFPPSETGAPPKDALPDVPASEVKRVARNAIEEAYAQLYGRVAKWAQPGDVNAATATIWIDLQKRNLL